MKTKGFIFFILSLTLSISISSQTLPQFSTDGNEIWYYVQFQRGKCVLQDMGENANLMTKEAVKGRSSQLWKVVGTKNSFELISKSGRHAVCNGTSVGSMFAAKASSTSKFKLHSTTTEFAPAWEIQPTNASGYSMNQWGGYGAERQLGLWNQNDVNNPLLFIQESEITVTDTIPTTLKEYSTVGSTTFVPDELFTLWYRVPVTKATCSNPWMDYALPIGNGQLGAMVYGGIHQDVLQFNDKTLWTGSSTDRGAYQTFGNLYMEDTGTDLSSGVKNYILQLDLANSKAMASYTNNTGTTEYKREYIASYPDKCIAVRLSSNGKAKISQRIYIYNPNGAAPKYENNGGTYKGKLQTVSYSASFKVVNAGGEIKSDSTGISVTNADEILIVLSAGTDYDPTATGFVSNTENLENSIYSLAVAASQKGWDKLYESHLADYKELYDRVKFHLAGAVNTKPTTVLVNTYQNARDSYKRMLEQLYFQYGRYLLISSSRGVDLPNNLQGIWNNVNNPAWQCDMHANINVQMNYWAAEKTNLSELHEKYLNYLYNMSQIQPVWKKYAKERSGQSTGWVNFTENNIFGHCTTWHNDYVEAGAWSCNHLWQHYKYTLDKDFLIKTALPVMISCVDFWMERLVKDENDGKWVCPKEWSPEHGPDRTITAHAQQIVWTLFSNTIDAIESVGTENAGITSERLESIKLKFENLDDGLATETYNGTFGTTYNGVNKGEDILREWKYVDYASGNGSEASHRHLSHLMSMYPFCIISPASDFFQPAIRSLKLRGLQSQGWSMGWKINLWARALDGSNCQELFKLAFRHSSDYVINMSSDAGGVYYNLLDSHSPFQIDGNFGVCAGMAEMLLQNQNDTIALLPALAPQWTEGSITGLKAEGNFEIDQTWSEGKLSNCRVKSNNGGNLILKHEGISKYSVKDINGNDVVTEKIDDNKILIKSIQGSEYFISTSPASSIRDVFAMYSKEAYIYTTDGRLIGTEVDMSKTELPNIYICNGSKTIK